MWHTFIRFLNVLRPCDSTRILSYILSNSTSLQHFLLHYQHFNSHIIFMSWSITTKPTTTLQLYSTLVTTQSSHALYETVHHSNTSNWNITNLQASYYTSTVQHTTSTTVFTYHLVERQIKAVRLLKYLSHGLKPKNSNLFNTSSVLQTKLVLTE